MINLEKMVKELGERAAKEDGERQKLEVIKTLTILYDKATAYTNIIMVVGYAGFFTIWSNMKIYMSAFDMRISAALMLFSILVFVMWEVTKMIHTANGLHRANKILNVSPAEFARRLVVEEQQTHAKYVLLMRSWRLVLLFTIFPALVAASILIYSFVVNL